VSELPHLRVVVDRRAEDVARAVALIAGEAIPITARVVAAADALATAAPQAAIAPRERKAAAQRLRALAGTALDPQLADAAIAVLAAEADAAGEYLPRTA
jgi:HD-GYP domain-containing protein (c-di-GMP phosphodiesterase class II)